MIHMFIVLALFCKNTLFYMFNIKLNKLEKQNVYSPNDDSYLFQEALIEEAKEL